MKVNNIMQMVALSIFCFGALIARDKDSGEVLITTTPQILETIMSDEENGLRTVEEVEKPFVDNGGSTLPVIEQTRDILFQYEGMYWADGGGSGHVVEWNQYTSYIYSGYYDATLSFTVDATGYDALSLTFDQYMSWCSYQNLSLIHI